MSAEPQDPRPQPQPAQPLSPSQERTWATITHVVAGGAMLLSAGTLGFVAALVIYLVYRDRGPFIRAHAANAVNIQLTALVGLVVSAILIIVLVGLLLYPLIVVAAVVIHGIAAVKANDGEWYDPPWTIRFVR
jgi:uncharacterized Tic20 family protein